MPTGPRLGGASEWDPAQNTKPDPGEQGDQHPEKQPASIFRRHWPSPSSRFAAASASVCVPRNTRSASAIASGPLARTTASPASPGAVAKRRGVGQGVHRLDCPIELLALAGLECGQVLPQLADLGRRVDDLGQIAAG